MEVNIYKTNKMEKKYLLALIISAFCLFSFSAMAAVEDSTVVITFNGSSASVEKASNVSQYVTVTTDGAHVTLTQSDDVSTTTCGEITYILTGSSTNGSLTLVGNFKATLSLQDLTLTNPNGPAINIQNGKRIKISVKRETINNLTDGESSLLDAWKGALQCKGHTEFKGYGTLNVTGKYAHAIWSKEYVTIKNCTINILSAVKDGLNCNQYFSMESGTLNISNYGDDGIQVGLKTNDTSAENTGNFTITGGTININTTGSTGSSIKAEGTITKSGGTINEIASALEEIEKKDGDEGNYSLNGGNSSGISVYSAIGTYIGTFPTLDEAGQSLPHSIYIIRAAGKSPVKATLP